MYVAAQYILQNTVAARFSVRISAFNVFWMPDFESLWLKHSVWQSEMRCGYRARLTKSKYPKCLSYDR